MLTVPGYRIVVRNGNAVVADYTVSARPARALRAYRAAQYLYGAINVRLIPPTTAS